MPEMSAGTEKLVQYLNEAYGLELRLETALQAHIAMTEFAPYKKRLKQHLTETKRHARDVKKRVKQLGGSATAVDAPGPAPVAEVAQVVLGGAQKAAALVQGPMHALRGTGVEEKQLKNAKTEYASEAEEIATYLAIETLAQTLGDKDTAGLARGIRREEERMRSFLEKEIPRLTKRVASAELPSAERKGGAAKRRRSGAPAKAGARVKASAKAHKKAAAKTKALTSQGGRKG
jgi:ferritin-like metal-binding protein YciE